MKNQPKRFLLGAVVGFAFASMLNWFACWYLPKRSSIRVLTADLQLEETYFPKQHKPEMGAPIKGVILKGSTLKVYAKKADINYVRFFTMISDDDLLPISEPIGVFEDR